MFCLVLHSHFSNIPQNTFPPDPAILLDLYLLSLLLYATCLRYLCHSDINWKKLELEPLSIIETPKFITFYTTSLYIF